MTTYHTRSNQSLALGSQLGGGGEGQIFAVPRLADSVAKIYTHPTSEHAAKLQVMVANPPEDPTRPQGHVSIAWPTDILYDPQARCAGFLMPRIDLGSSVPLLKLYNPKSRKQHAPDFTWE